MSTGKKIKHAAKTAEGTVKEAAGKVTGNESLTIKGKAEKAKGHAAQAGQKAKDALKS